MCLSGALDLISPAVVNHHKRVAYIAFRLAKELDLPKEKQVDLILAGALHDVGALSLGDRINALTFELDNPGQHSYRGYLLLKTFKPLEKVASLVCYHHLFWEDEKDLKLRGEEVPQEAHLLHLADRIDVLIDREKEILGQVKIISQTIQENSGTMFKPELVEVFLSLARKECFWLNIISPSLNRLLVREAKEEIINLDVASLLDLAKLFSRIIDFRSRFTATHSSGVAAIAQALARLLGLSEQDCQSMAIAGYLHDLGKLAIPAEILEKPGALDHDEYNLIKSHTFHTYRILENIEELATINAWASFHHERLDGEGYPFHHGEEELSQGARIMAVADVFTAITENRPYRSGMTKEKALGILQQMAKDYILDARVIETLSQHYEKLNSIRITAQKEAAQEYEEFWQQLYMGLEN